MARALQDPLALRPGQLPPPLSGPAPEADGVVGVVAVQGRAGQQLGHVVVHLPPQHRKIAQLPPVVVVLPEASVVHGGRGGSRDLGHGGQDGARHQDLPGDGRVYVVDHQFPAHSLRGRSLREGPGHVGQHGAALRGRGANGAVVALGGAPGHGVQLARPGEGRARFPGAIEAHQGPPLEVLEPGAAAGQGFGVLEPGHRPGSGLGVDPILQQRLGGHRQVPLPGGELLGRKPRPLGAGRREAGVVGGQGAQDHGNPRAPAGPGHAGEIGPEAGGGPTAGGDLPATASRPLRRGPGSGRRR